MRAPRAALTGRGRVNLRHAPVFGVSTPVVRLLLVSLGDACGETGVDLDGAQIHSAAGRTCCGDSGKSPDRRPVPCLAGKQTALEAEGGRRPPSQRRPVLDLPELAEAIGFSRQGMYNFAGGDLKMVNLSTLSAIINELRGRGFPTDVGDILVAYPSDTVEDRAA